MIHQLRALKSTNLPRLTVSVEHHTQKGHSFLTGVVLVVNDRRWG